MFAKNLLVAAFAAVADAHGRSGNVRITSNTMYPRYNVQQMGHSVHYHDKVHDSSYHDENNEDLEQCNTDLTQLRDDLRTLELATLQPCIDISTMQGQVRTISKLTSTLKGPVTSQTADVQSLTSQLAALQTRADADDLTQLKTDVSDLEAQRDAALAYIIRLDAVQTNYEALQAFSERVTTAEASMLQYKTDILANTAAIDLLNDSLTSAPLSGYASTWATQEAQVEAQTIASDYFTVMSATDINVGDPFFAEFCVQPGEKFEFSLRAIVDGAGTGNIDMMSLVYLDDLNNSIVLVQDEKVDAPTSDEEREFTLYYRGVAPDTGSPTEFRLAAQTVGVTIGDVTFPSIRAGVSFWGYRVFGTDYDT